MRKGSVRGYVYARIGELAGDAASVWSRRMNIDIHDIDSTRLIGAAISDGAIETTVNGTNKDGTPTCAILQPTGRQIVAR